MFKRPTKDDCLQAIGLKPKQAEDGRQAYDVQPMKLLLPLPPDLITAIQPDPQLFDPIPNPGPSDWLANYKESGQTFKEFMESSRRIPDEQRTTIYILPLVFFENVVPSDVVNQLTEFASIFFSMPVKVLQTESFSQHVSHRTNEFSGLVQVHAGQILNKLMNLLPTDAFCLGAITMCDLYPRDSWNFVFGLASMNDRVGVYSLARYMPGFDEGIASSTAALSSDEKSILLKRSCLLMCHEMCHMFGLNHCIYFHCLMNGSNHFEESDNTPLQLCPVCLRKLHASCQFDITDRYSKLANFCNTSSGMKHESEWFEKRLQLLK